MEIKEFIEKAIEGGWEAPEDWELIHPALIYEILLDPKAWEAVGRVEGWSEYQSVCCSSSYSRYPKDTEQPNGSIIPVWFNWCDACKDRCKVSGGGDYKDKLHQFIDHLIQGKSIEEALKEI